MPIIPNPGPRPTVTPRTEEILVPGEFPTFTFGPTEIFYATDLPTGLRAGLGATIVNNGVVWIETTRPQVFFVVGSQPSITNHGTIYLRGETQVALNNGGDRLVNTGNIFVISNSGWARVVQGGGFTFVENSGVIAAQAIQTSPESNSGNATAIDAFNGAAINNLAGGQILAEAADLAIAISLGGIDLNTGDPGVTNRGLIEAAATTANGLSFGIYSFSAGNSIVNHGTIRAEFAVYGVADILNATGGVIEGLVVQEEGVGLIENNGLITGRVYMGDGSDRFFGTGSVDGFVDMGWHDDIFEGSASANIATGNRGDDTLSGFGGNDLLLGGFGNDTLVGGTGNDGLFGEFGDDTIWTEGGDFIHAGTGDDRIELGDYTFEAISGGGGFDVLAMAAGARNFSLAAMLASQRIGGIDAIELRGNQGLAIDSASIAKLTDNGSTLWVDSTSSDAVHLAGNWTRGSDITFSGVDYQVWEQGSFTVLVSAMTSVTPNSAPSYGGFDAVAAGAAALRPGATAGLDYTPRETFVSEYAIYDPDPFSEGSYEFVVTSDDIFYTVGEGFVFRASETLATVVNNGVIASFNDETNFANGVALTRQVAYVDFINNGLVAVESTGAVGGIHGEGITSVAVYAEGNITNRGEINIFSAAGNVLGAWVSTRARHFDNSGTVIAVSGALSATGVNADGTDLFGQQAFFNTGTIYAEGANVSVPSEHPVAGAVAVGVRAGGSLTNDGIITAAIGANAVEGARSVGIVSYSRTATGVTVTNNGEVTGTISVFFYGTESGDGHQLANNGLLVGDVHFGGGVLFSNAGNDTYNNSNGETRGTVFGFDGDDSFTGGRFADVFNGGLGNDTLNGGGNVDTVIVSGNRSAYTITQTSVGVFQIVGPDGTDTLTAIEYLQFDDQTMRLLPGTGVTVNFATADPSVYQAAMNNIRDFDGNALGGDGGWLRIGSADVNGDGDLDQILVNRTIGRFATIGTASDGQVYFSDHGWAGETRVAGIYIDPLVANGQVVAGSGNDSQRRFQNDLEIENINRVLGADDYDNDGIWEVYFALTDGTAYLRALMHADGNIRYANYQSRQEVIDYLTANGYDESTFGNWFPSGQEQEVSDDKQEDSDVLPDTLPDTLIAGLLADMAGADGEMASSGLDRAPNAPLHLQQTGEMAFWQMEEVFA